MFVVSVEMYLFLVEHYLFIRQAVNNERSSRCHTVEGFCSLSANLYISIKMREAGAVYSIYSCTIFY